ncbi:hypothetical protein [Ancylobacter oerskovii]|uniref:Uncharacterized protein n=1 Tax=Ancylobacter oerskovii TaxID=459519 RepID=A0ABW4Z2U0_9HYPH|nr:hypothetical protein [Ancylobacter oerskovii]MBS7546279.1 hypothetical protein [Ancylobacter oerskovii]
MSWFSRLFGRAAPAQSIGERNASVKAVTIDASGPEFFDAFPSREDIDRRLRQSGLFKPEASDWIIDAAFKAIGGRAEGSITAITRAGRLLAKDELKEIGYRSNAKIGRGFVDALAVSDVRFAIEEMQRQLRVAACRANLLHNLRRAEEAVGIKRVIFRCGVPDAASKIEREFEGKTMLTSKARELIINHDEQLTYTWFEPIIEF